MSDKIEFRGAFSREIFLDSQRLHNKRRSIGWTLVAIAMLVLGLFFWNSRAEVISAALVVVGISVFAAFAFRRIQWNRVYNKSPYLADEVHGWVSADSFHLETANACADLPWSKYVRALSDDRLILLYPSPYLFHVLAREFFGSDEEWTRAKSFILEGVKVDKWRRLTAFCKLT